MLQELKDSPNLIMLNDTGKHILDLLTPRQRNWLNAEHITAIYTLKYNQVIIGFLYIAAHDGQDFAPEELRYLEKSMLLFLLCAAQCQPVSECIPRIYYR